MKQKIDLLRVALSLVVVLAKIGSNAVAAEPSAPEPRVVSTSPAIGAHDVDPKISEITVTFDRDMAGGFSWTGPGPDFPPAVEGKRPVWRDKRTCALPVKLEEGKYYRVGINSSSRLNFRSTDGVPVKPTAVYFTTKGASEELKDRTARPRIVSTKPANGASGVDPALSEVRVTFSTPMKNGFSWTGGGPQFPGAAGKKAYWT